MSERKKEKNENKRINRKKERSEKRYPNDIQGHHSSLMKIYVTSLSLAHLNATHEKQTLCK